MKTRSLLSSDVPEPTRFQEPSRKLDAYFCVALTVIATALYACYYYYCVRPGDNSTTEYWKERATQNEASNYR